MVLAVVEAVTTGDSVPLDVAVAVVVGAAVRSPPPTSCAAAKQTTSKSTNMTKREIAFSAFRIPEMSFWDSFDEPATGVSSVMARETFSLTDILSEDDVLQECASSASLVAYLENQTAALVEMITLTPGTEQELRCSFLSCEILRFGHAAIARQLLTPVIFARLVHILSIEAPLNPVAAEHVAKVLTKLLETNPSDVLSQLDVAGALMVHLDNASMVNAFLAVVWACTEEVESEPGENCRLERHVSFERATWLADLNVPLKLCRIMSASTSSSHARQHALEVFEKMISFSRASDNVVNQLTKSPNLFEDSSSIEAALAASLISPFAPLSHFETFSASFCRNSIESNHCARLIASASLLKALVAAEKLSADAVTSLLPLLVEAMFSRENCTIFAVIFVETIRSCIASSTYRAAVLQPLVLGRLVESFVSSETQWPRSQLFGLLIRFFDDLQNQTISESENEYFGTIEFEKSVWPQLKAHLEREKTPLFGDRDPDRYIAKLDLKGGDIDQI